MRGAILPMLQKVQQYEKAALQKPVYICAPILDPRRKLSAINSTSLTSLGWTKDKLVEYFNQQAERFKPPHDPDIEIVELEDQDQTHDDDRPRHFIKRRKTIPVCDQVREYLTSPIEDEDCEVLPFWRRSQRNWPILARMASAMLAVPATASPSERAFSASGRVMSDYRSSMTPQNLEAQVCLKTWFKAIK